MPYTKEKRPEGVQFAKGDGRREDRAKGARAATAARHRRTVLQKLMLRHWAMGAMKDELRAKLEAQGISAEEVTGETLALFQIMTRALKGDLAAKRYIDDNIDGYEQKLRDAQLRTEREKVRALRAQAERAAPSMTDDKVVVEIVEATDENGKGSPSSAPA